MIILEDVLPHLTHKWMMEVCLSNAFEWAFCPDTAYGTGGVKSASPGFSKTLLETNARHREQVWFERFELLLLNLIDRSCCNPNALQRVRFGLYIPTKHEGHNSIHTDRDTPHTTLLYYLNDNDGDTFFFDRDEKTLIKRVTPKANTMVVFDGSTPHASSNPSVGWKISLNLNIDGFSPRILDNIRQREGNK